ncbi:MAG: YdcF family protein [Candidatus Falkowbacteria bacterium]|nr:YdcF family protein [Candidatus Falkowbacteria bacterium]
MKQKIIIVLGRNWKEYPELSQESKIIATATVIIMNQFKDTMVIISGGKTAGLDNLSEARAIRDFMIKESPGVNIDLIILEEESIDTFANAEKILKLLKNELINTADKELWLMTSKVHLKRATMIFNKFFKINKPVAAEEIIVEHLKKEKNYFQISKIEIIKEFILRLITTIDRQGKFLRKLTKVIRK